jgi:CO/xanthine dehydrogenase FAD-binding subunit
LLALDAVVALHGNDGPNETPLEAFFQSRETLPPDSIVTSVSFRKPAANALRFLKVSRVKPKGASVLSIAAVLDINDGVVSAARIAFGAMANTPIRAHAFERSLIGTALTEHDLGLVLPVALGGTTPSSDAIASDWYRRAVLPVHLRRLLLAQAS